MNSEIQHSGIMGTICLIFLFLMPLSGRGEHVTLKDGTTIEGVSVRFENNRLTVRTANGISSYSLGELDQDWVNEHLERLETKYTRKGDSLKQSLGVVRGLFGEESLARTSPFLKDSSYTLPIAGGFLLMGLVYCFFGWKWFRFWTISGGVFGGIMMGLAVGAIAALALDRALPQGTPPVLRIVVLIGLGLVAGIPLAILFGSYGRRYAMFDARLNSMADGPAGCLGLLFSMSRFAYFDLSIIWGNALLGAVLISGAGYCMAVPLLQVEDASLQTTIAISTLIGLVCALFGGVLQIQSLRAASGNSRAGDY